MGESLELARADHSLVTRDVKLGPMRPKLPRVVGMVVGVPIGIGIIFPPHGLLIGAGAGIFATYIVGSFLYWLRAGKRFATENNLAIGALGRGEIAKAREVFLRWAPSSNVLITAVARHNLGWALVLEGRLEEAARIFEDAAEHHQRQLTRQSLLPTTRADAALCHALLGQLDEAAAWCAKAEEPAKVAPRPGLGAVIALVRAVIDCRQGHAAEAMVRLEHAWAEYETVTTGEVLRLMRVVRAYACAAADGPRNQGMVERVLGDMKPRYAGELVILGGGWPEMAAFLAAHGLAG